jgi:hypothetical protein
VSGELVLLAEARATLGAAVLVDRHDGLNVIPRGNAGQVDGRRAPRRLAARTAPAGVLVSKTRHYVYGLTPRTLEPVRRLSVVLAWTYYIALMPSPSSLAALVVLGAAQAAPIDGTWELTRIYRSGAVPQRRAVPLDSTVYLRLTLASHPGDWISGWLYRRYRGAPERAKIEAGPLRGTGRYVIGADLERPASTKARTAAWLVGDTLRLGTSFVPDVDSLELRRVKPDDPYPATVQEVVARP